MLTYSQLKLITVQCPRDSIKEFGKVFIDDKQTPQNNLTITDKHSFERHFAFSCKVCESTNVKVGC